MVILLSVEQNLVRQSSGSRQAVGRQSSGSRQAVIRQLSGSRQAIFKWSLSNDYTDF